MAGDPTAKAQLKYFQSFLRAVGILEHYLPPFFIMLEKEVIERKSAFHDVGHCSGAAPVLEGI